MSKQLHIPKEMLASLQPTWTLAVATNAEDSNADDIRVALNRLGLGPLFDEVYCSLSLGCKRPCAEFFRAILNDQKLDRSRVVMIGDDLNINVLGTNYSGICSVWFKERSLSEPNRNMFRTIHDFEDLPQSVETFGVSIDE